MYKSLLLLLFLAFSEFQLTVYSQTPPENIQIINPQQNLKDRELSSMKDEIIRLRKEIAGQKETTLNLVQRLNELATSQSSFITELRTTIFTNQDNRFKDAFILNKEGKPFAFIDTGLKIYEYGGGNLLGWINSDTNEVIRNFDNSVVAIIESDFVIDESGHPIGSIERSETLRWDREKLYGKIQKAPVSHFFERPQTPRRFILSPYRSSEWSTQRIEDVLNFSEKSIQRIK
jgi:hypothetical protein